VTVALTFVSWLDLLTSLLLAGGTLFAVLIAVPSPLGTRVLRWSAAILGIVLLVDFALVALRIHWVTAIAGVALLHDLLALWWTRLWFLRVGGLAVLAALLGTARPNWRVAAAIASLWLLARSLQGHAGAHGTLPALIDWVHLLTAATWLGSLTQFALLSSHSPLTATRLRRLATVSVILLVPAGIYAAFLHMRNLHQLLYSPYGRTLLAKIGLVLVLIAVGATNHFVHVPAVIGGEREAGRRLHRAAVLELALGAAVLLLSALLGVLPMPHVMPIDP